MDGENAEGFLSASDHHTEHADRARGHALRRWLEAGLPPQIGDDDGGVGAERESSLGSRSGRHERLPDELGWPAGITGR